MKQLLVSVMICLSAMATAQISFSGKANAVFQAGSPSWKGIKEQVGEIYNNGGSSVSGFNVGVSAKINIPLVSFYIMPELYYTHFTNKNYDSETQTSLKANTDRLDLPVLVGYNILGDTFSVFAGPVASYNLTKKETFSSLQSNIKNDFSVGYQFGAEVRLKRLILNARYEGAFSKDQRNFINLLNNSDYKVQYDTRPSLFMVGLGYKF